MAGGGVEGGVVVGARGAEERAVRRAEADHVEGAAEGEGAEEVPERLARLLDGGALHAAAAVDEEEQFAQGGRGVGAEAREEVTRPPSGAASSMASGSWGRSSLQRRTRSGPMGKLAVAAEAARPST